MDIKEKFQNSDKYTKYSIIIIILFSLIVLSLTSIYHVSGDGCWYMSVAKFIAENKKFPSYHTLDPLGREEPFWSPPLYHTIVAVIYFLFNFINHDLANFAVKFVSPIFGIFSLIFSFLVIKKLTNSKIAFYSAIFLAFIPIFIDYSVLSYVEIIMTFFVILSIYFILNDKIVLSGVSVGLSFLAKYNGIFIVPVLLFIIYKKYENKKLFLKKSLILISISLLIALPWMIRNWALLGNPIWPFLNFIFHGYNAQSYSKIDISRIWEPCDYGKRIPCIIETTYLGSFGVPDGNYDVFKNFNNIPFVKSFFYLWLTATLIFFIIMGFGIYMGLRYNKNKLLFLLWLVSYLLLFLVYVINVGWRVTRIILPAFPILAIFWAFGYEKISIYEQRMFNSSKSRFLPILISLIIIGMIGSLAIKTVYSSNQWDKFKMDFDWIKQNTDKKSVFIAKGQCIPFNIERKSLYLENNNINDTDYIWFNQNFILDSKSEYNETELKSLELRKYEIAYSNTKTGTIIYKIRH